MTGGPFGAIGAALLLALLFALPAVAPSDVVFLAGLFYVQAVFGISWNLMFNYTGLISFGHAAAFSIGAYGQAFLARSWPDLPWVATVLGGALVCALFSAAVGFLALRRSQGVYFAILTLALSQIVYLVISYTPALGRDDGLAGVRRPDLGIQHTASSDGFYWVLLLGCLALVALMWWFVHGRAGRVMRAISQDPERTVFLGLPIFRYRLVAFVVAAVMAGLAGALYGTWLQIVTPEIAHWSYSALPIFYTLLGGFTSFWAPAIGALAFALLDYATRSMLGASELIVGGVLLVVVLALPGGLVGLFEAIRKRLAHQRAG